MANSVCLDFFGRYGITLSNAVWFWSSSGNLICCLNFISLINKSVVCRHNKMISICLRCNSLYQSINLFNCFFASSKDFIFRSRFISTGIYLIMINIHNVLSGKDRTKVCLFHCFHWIKLNALTVYFILFKNSFPLLRGTARFSVYQYIIRRTVLNRLMRK